MFGWFLPRYPRHYSHHYRRHRLGRGLLWGLLIGPWLFGRALRWGAGQRRGYGRGWYGRGGYGGYGGRSYF
jgi:hypothetical protein